MLDFLLGCLLIIIGFQIPDISLYFFYPFTNNRYLLIILFCIFIVISGVFMFNYGPNELSFGLFIGSGWKLLNELLDNLFNFNHQKN